MGITSDLSAEQDATATRDHWAAEHFRELMLPHTAALIDQARTALDRMPPARHLPDWRLLLDDLEHAATECRRIWDIEPAAGDEPAIRARDAALWPYVTTWADHGYLVLGLIGQLRPRTPAPALTADEHTHLVWQVLTARREGRIEVAGSWWDATGRVLHLVRLDAAGRPLLALAGDLDNQLPEILGRFETADKARAACPPPVPAGVLRPDVSSRQTIPPRRAPPRDLTREVIEARSSADVAQALLAVTDGDNSEVTGLSTLLATAAEYASAMETGRGRHLAARLEELSAQVDMIGRAVHHLGQEMKEPVGVLPPHRTPLPRHLPVPHPDADRTGPGGDARAPLDRTTPAAPGAGTGPPAARRRS